MLLTFLILDFLLQLLLYREVLKLRSNQTFVWEYTRYASLTSGKFLQQNLIGEGLGRRGTIEFIISMRDNFV